MAQDWDEKVKATLLISLTGCGILAAAGDILYDYVFNRNPKLLFGPLKKNKESFITGDILRAEISEETLAWAERTNFSQRQTYAYDGTSLNAYSFEQQKGSRRWLIAVHGYGQNAAAMFTIAKPFYEAGYNVLIPECRGCGRSGGNYYGMGWADRLDVIKWCRQITANQPQAEIVLYGISTGADAVLMASGEDNLPVNVRCVISDSAYTRLTDLSNYTLKQRNMPAGILTFATSFITYLRAGYSFPMASAVNQVSKSHTPTLFIHGSKDELFPVEMAYELYEAAECPKDIYIADQAAHGYAMYTNYTKYWEVVRKFTRNFINDQKDETSRLTRLKNQVRRIRKSDKPGS